MGPEELRMSVVLRGRPSQGPLGWFLPKMKIVWPILGDPEFNSGHAKSELFSPETHPPLTVCPEN